MSDPTRTSDREPTRERLLDAKDWLTRGILNGKGSQYRDDGQSHHRGVLLLAVERLLAPPASDEEIEEAVINYVGGRGNLWSATWLTGFKAAVRRYLLPFADADVRDAACAQCGRRHDDWRHGNIASGEQHEFVPADVRDETEATR